MKVLIINSVLLLSIARSAELNIEKLKLSAIRNSFNLKSIESDLDSSDQKVKIRKSKFYPKAGLEIGQELTFSGGNSERENILAVYGELNVFNGNKDSLSLKKSKIEKQALGVKFKRQEHLTKIEVESLFYNYLYLLEKNKIIDLAIRRNAKHISMVRKRYNAGMVTKTDLLEFQLKSSNLQTEIETLDLDIKRAKEKLLNFSGIETQPDSHIAGELPHLHIQTNLNQALELSSENNTLMKHQALEKKNFELSRKISKSKIYPSVDLKGKYGLLSEQETGFKNNATVGQVALIASWEAFSGGARKAESKMLSSQIDSLDFKMKQLSRDLINEVKNNYEKIKILEKQIDSIEKNQSIALRLYRKTLKEYNKGVKDSGALVGASDMYKSLSEKVFETKYNHLNTKLALERIIGSTLDFETIRH